VNNETVDIDTEDVEYDQTDAQPPASNTSSLAKRPLELTNIEGSFNRGVTSASLQRPLFILDKDTITAADATRFRSKRIAGKTTSLLAMSSLNAQSTHRYRIRADTSFTMLSDTDVSH
jgi:hypothetical protein